MNLKELRSRVEALRGQRDYLLRELENTEYNLEFNTMKLEDCTNAREIIRQVAVFTQEQLSFHLEDIVSNAMESVFDHPYKFKVKFETSRNKTECVLRLEDHNGFLVSPLDASGGGVVDVCSFALRIAIWSISSPRTRSVLILDEPFRYLSRDLLDNAGNMLKELSEKLGLQILMISHEKSLVDMADNVIVVKKNSKGVSINAVGKT